MGKVHLRVDGRMIHGQVTNAWSRLLETEKIFVVDDEVANDETQIMLLEFAVPPGIDFAAYTVDNVYDILSNDEIEDQNILIIFKTLNAAVDLYKKGYKFDKINIGGIYFDEGKEKYDKALFLDEEDIKNIEYLLENGVDVYYQPAPMNKKVNISEYF